MPKRLRCRDVGFECDEEIKGETDEEVVRLATEHARAVHHVPAITPELAGRVRAAIRNA